MKMGSRRRVLKLVVLASLIAFTAFSLGVVVGQNQGLVLIKPFSAPVAVSDPDVRPI